MNAASLIGASVVRYALPYASPTAGLTERTGLWLRLTDQAGHVGLGDAAPWPTSPESLDDVESGLRAAACAQLDQAESWQALTLPDGPVRFAVESALLALEAHRTGERPAALLERALRGAGYVPEDTGRPTAISALVNDVPSALAAVAAGYRTLKVKFDGSDTRLVAAVRAAVPSDVALRVDANGKGDPAQTPALLTELVSLGVELIEEPAGLVSLRPSGPRPRLFADESVRTVAALLESPADGVVLKPGFTGLRAAIALAVAAQRRGLPIVVTHVLESAVGRDVALAFANALGTRPFADGLAPPAWAPGALDAPRPTLLAPVEPRGPLDLPDPLRGSALARPSHPALESSGETWTWRELDDVAARLATLTRLLGIAPGDRVTTLTPLSIAAAVLLHGLRRASAVAIPAAPERAESAVLSGTWALHPIAAPGRPWAVFAPRATERGGLTLPAAPEPFHAPDSDAFAILTSGTTGEPRLIALGATQMTLSAFASTIRLGHLPTDRWLLTLPLHHVGGLMVLVRSALIGTTVRIETGGTDAVATQLHSGDVSLVSLVPAQLQRLLADGASPFAPAVRAVLVGGAPMPPVVLDQARALGVPLALSWGMTETSSQVATQHPSDLAPSLAAPPLAFARIAADTEGRLHVYGPQARGHVETRDLGSVADDGVRVTGRLDDTFISGGVNVDPTEVEAALRRHPAIADVMVVGIADDAFGERAGALYVTDTTADLEPSLAAWARAHLPPAARPVVWLAVPTLPLTPLGKPARSTAAALLTTTARAASLARPTREA
ncbi:MAG: AMP-binding protein [Myxococcales bacterium]|nr:AMP-binding protein [Myxococcales bacterium]